MRQKRDQMLACSCIFMILSIGLLLLFFSTGLEGKIFGRFALAAAISSILFSGIALILDTIDGRRPLIGWSEYTSLKQKTVKRLRGVKSLGLLDQAEIQRSRSAFLMKAEELGVMRDAAEEDFEIEIRRRVMR